MTQRGDISAIAERTWEQMRSLGISPAPRHYELWFAFCSGDKPALAQRLTTLLRAGQPITDAQLNELYREFVGVGTDMEVMREGSSELTDIATEMATRVSAERAMVSTLGQALGNWSTAIRAEPSRDDLRRAAATLGDASVQAGERLQAMEHLFSASVRRIADLKQRLVLAEQEATRDALTGLANRRSFDSMLRRAAMQAASDRTELVLLLLDIDHFKRFNDSYGHQLGDNVLRLVAGVLSEHVKQGDLAARYGGEEFAIILPGASLAFGKAVAEQVRGVLEKRPIMNRNTGQRLGVVTCSIGVGRYRMGEPVGELVDRTDKLLYRAKQEGRNRVMDETGA